MRLRRRRALNPRFARAICHKLLREPGIGTGQTTGFFSPYPKVRKGGLTNTSILIGQEPFDLSLLRFVDDLGAAQAALALGRLVAEEVALVGLLVLEVPLGGHLEALLGARVGLHLRHGSFLG